MPVKGLVRGCSTRVAGGAYATMGLSDRGHPLECFMADLPRPVTNADYVSLGLSSIGVKAIEIKGVMHLFDIIGQEHYPSVADFLEEARRFGISRRLPPQLPWERIGTSSRLVVLHRRAILANAEAYVDAEMDIISTLGVRICVARHADQHCEKGRTHHDEARDISPCSRLWWQDVEGGERKLEGEPDSGYDARMRQVVRTIGSTSYVGFSPPDGIRGQHQLGIIGLFPIHKVEVVQDAASGSHQRMIELAQQSRLPVDLVNE